MKEHSHATLKKAPMDKPVLRNPETFHSDVGLGAVSQTSDDGEEHPIAQYSRKRLPRERRCAAVKKECLAVVDGIFEHSECT